MSKIVDIHTHILPGVDDGSKNLQESIQIIQSLYEQGITDIVLTPHYIKDTNYNATSAQKKKILESVKANLREDVRLYLGNEVLVCEDLIDLLKKHKINTINDSKYLLIELPFSGHLNSLQSILCELVDQGITPIIAHPERYQFLQKDKNRIRSLLEFNCLLQCNVDSLTGKYGRQAKKLMKWLLKNDLVQIVATDSHHVDDHKMLEKAYQKLKKRVGPEKYEQLTYSNPMKVIRDEVLEGNLDYLIREGRKGR